MNTNEEDLLVTANLANSLKCPCCKYFFTPPIFQCSNGHSLCSVCTEKQKDCPECSISLMSKFRNISLERMLESIESICRFPGCGTKVLLIGKQAHESLCEHNPSMNCVFQDCTWEGEGLIEHLKAKHNVKEFEMPSKGGVRGWNSKTWKNADWGYSIWKFNDIQILNKSISDGDTFYLYVYHIGSKSLTMKLSTKHDQYSIFFTIQTISVKQSRHGYTALPFHISIAVAEKYLLEPAEGLEEGYKKLSIKVKLIE
jgi:hypothetical protein